MSSSGAWLPRCFQSYLNRLCDCFQSYLDRSYNFFRFFPEQFQLDSFNLQLHSKSGWNSVDFCWVYPCVLFRITSRPVHGTRSWHQKSVPGMAVFVLVHHHFLVVESTNHAWIQETVEAGILVRSFKWQKNCNSVRSIHSSLDTVGDKVRHSADVQGLLAEHLIGCFTQTCIQSDDVRSVDHFGQFVGLDG